MIKLEDISVTFNRGTPLEKEVLKDLSLTINAGEFVTIIGGNGAGKSTLMNLLAGEVTPCSGKILIDGKDLTKKPTHARASLVSRVFQDPLLGSCSELTIEENLSLAFSRGAARTFGTALNKGKRSIFKDLVGELKIGLEDRLQDPIKALSGGQRQAVSLLMATLKASKLLLLDEHTAALDPAMARKVMELTDLLVERNKLTTLMITHSMTQALEHGSRTLLMHHGKIEKDLSGDKRKALSAKDLLEFFDLQ